jgi:hypothetical protein
MIAKFWWGHKGNDARIPWMSWRKMGRTKSKGGLGYRDLENFNTVLLAKQGWRLIQNPQSLVARILKEKYFSGCSFLDSVLGKRPSYAWRIIWNAKKLLSKGLIWGVGDVMSIKLWKDCWIPLPSTFKVQSPERILNSDATVSVLIDKDLRWWNVSLIHEIFLQDEAALICSIPICPGSQRDRLVWTGTKNGLFMVKSAYHLAQATNDLGASECLSSVQLAQKWKNIWSIKGPPMVKTFLWQACSEILPTRANLFWKHVLSSPLCPICEIESETVAHALWACPAAMDVWTESFKSIHKCSFIHANFADIVELLFHRLEKHQLQLFAVTARLIWLHRNKWVFDKEFQLPAVITKIAHEQYNAYEDAELSRAIHQSVATNPSDSEVDETAFWGG